MALPIEENVWKSRRVRWRLHRALVVETLIQTHLGDPEGLEALLQQHPFLVSDCLLSRRHTYPVWILQCASDSNASRLAQHNGVERFGMTTRIPGMLSVLDALHRLRTKNLDQVRAELMALEP